VLTDGDPITAQEGATSPVITIGNSPIADGGTITIDVSTLRWYYVSSSIADSNIEVHSTASAPVVWTPAIDPSGDTVILTSSGGDTAVGDSITVTFRGTSAEPWIPSTGYTTVVQTVTRTDTAETAVLTFVIDTPDPHNGRLAATDGAIVTTETGSTSPVLTILDLPIADGVTITVDVEPLGMLFSTDRATDANVQVTSSAATPVVWTRSVSLDGKTLTLTGTGGATNPGDTVTLTFTGVAGNTWVHGAIMLGVVAIRHDTSRAAVFNVQIDL
jgi:hypothetical protein